MLFVFAHGAGLPSTSRWMQRWAEQLRRVAPVVTFDYPYMASGRRIPDPLPRLIAAHRDEVRRAKAERGGPIVLIGKSMGARVSCHVALEEDVTGVVCLGYPLRAAGSGKLRDQVLLASTVPVLFVQGTRDPLCPLDELGEVLAKSPARSEVYVVQGGDHSLELRKRELATRGLTQSDVERDVLLAISRFAGLAT